LPKSVRTSRRIVKCPFLQIFSTMEMSCSIRRGIHS
jgi:hypothetical protein